MKNDFTNKDRADIRECIKDLHERLRIIETKFSIVMDEEQRDIWGDLMRDIVLPIETESKQKPNLTDKSHSP